MKIFAFAIAACLLFSTVAHAFQTGKWIAKNGDWQAEIEIKKDNAQYRANFNICAQARPKVEACYSAENADARIDGNSLQIKVDNRIGIEVEADNQGIRVYTDFTRIRFNVAGDRPESLISNKELNNILLNMNWKKK